MIEKEDMGKMRGTGIDRRQYTRLLGIFIRATREDLTSLRAAVSDSDADALKHAAHHIKGAAEGLELGEIAYNAKFIEEHVGRTDRWGEFIALCDEIDRQLTAASRQFGIAEWHDES